MIKKGLTFIYFLMAVTFLFSSEFYDQGLKDYRDGNRDMAVRNLKKALESEPSNDGACLYLGVIYQNLGNLPQAEKYYVQGMEMSGLHYADLSFNFANLLFNQKRYEEAAALYEQLILTPGAQRTSSLLNLANLSVNTGSYNRAVDLYLEYLLEDPETPQRAKIEEMVSLLQQSIDRAEAERLAEEERIRQEEEAARQRELEEQQRLAEEARQRELAEQRRLEEEERQKALLADILNTLSTSGQETQNFTAESEKVEEVFEESDLDD